MKDYIILILAMVFIMICLQFIGAKNTQNNNKSNIPNQNAYYEKYLDKEITGAELATIITKAMEQNENNGVNKDSKNHFINNNTNSLQIDLKIRTVNNTYNTYAMEAIYNKGISEFIQNFGTGKFKCINIEYHKNTGSISKMLFAELT